jgi:hypothetical protein
MNKQVKSIQTPICAGVVCINKISADPYEEKLHLLTSFCSEL